VLQIQDLALNVYGDLLGEVSVGNRGGHLSDVTHLAGKIVGHRVDVVSEVLPGSCHAFDLSAASKFAFCSDLSCDTGDFGGKSVELVHHCVDCVLEVEDLPAHFDGDLLREVTVGNRGGHFGDVAHLPRQVARHRV